MEERKSGDEDHAHQIRSRRKINLSLTVLLPLFLAAISMIHGLLSLNGVGYVLASVAIGMMVTFFRHGSLPPWRFGVAGMALSSLIGFVLIFLRSAGCGWPL